MTSRYRSFLDEPSGPGDMCAVKKCFYKIIIVMDLVFKEWDTDWARKTSLGTRRLSCIF